MHAGMQPRPQKLWIMEVSNIKPRHQACRHAIQPVCGLQLAGLCTRVTEEVSLKE